MMNMTEILFRVNKMAANGKPTIIVMVGGQASGKSTFVDEFVKHRPMRVIGSDRHLDKIAAEKGISYNDAFNAHAKDAGRATTADYNDAMAKGQDMIIDQTNMSAANRNKWLAQLGTKYNTVAVVARVSPDVQAKRLAERAKTQNKFVHPSIVKQFMDRYEAPTDLEFDKVFTYLP